MFFIVKNPIIEAVWTKYRKELSSYKFTLLNTGNSLLVSYLNDFKVSSF